ncbi:ribokinase [Pseudoxanthomonas sp. UTMC 1351]|uniref:ribokinase n=1 Tax=Pseudoxanthomonas sp. UTMC 1351 TaxID=2695853 RepID=UPI0034CD96B7
MSEHHADRHKNILVAGSANLDFVMLTPHVPAPGETVLGREFATFPGGKGANQAVACAKAGGALTRMLLALGEDAFAAPLEASLREAGVALSVVRSSAASTGMAFICLAEDGENAITVAPGANSLLGPADLPALESIGHVLLQLETPLETVEAYALAARAAGVRVLLNAAPAQVLPAQLLKAVDVLVVNEGELAALTGTNDLAEGIARIQVPCLVVTLGARGCYARAEGRVILQPAFVIDAVDTTAAGDTFCGVLAAHLGQGAELADALRHASAASALACTRLGAQSSIPTRVQVEDFLRTAPAPSPDAYARLAAYCGMA